MLKIRKGVSLITRIKNTGNSLVEGFNNRFERLEKRVAGTFAEKWLKFWVNISRDYRDVAIDIAKEIREKPSKAIIIGTSGWLATTFYIYNPSATHFQDAFRHASNRAAIVHHTQVRPDVLNYLKYVENCYNNETIRYTSFGLFSVIWIDKNPKQNSTYENQCDYIQYSYKDKFNNIIDVGFLDSWWLLIKRMKDYDVNF